MANCAVLKRDKLVHKLAHAPDIGLAVVEAGDSGFFPVGVVPAFSKLFLWSGYQVID